MSDSESPFESETNAFEGESSNGLFDSDSEAIVNFGAEDGEDTDVEILGEGTASVLTHDIGKGLMGRQPEPLAAVYRDGSHFGIDLKGEFGVPKEHLFGVNYLGPNKITEWEIAKYRAEYRILDSVRMRILCPTESLSKSKDGEVDTSPDQPQLLVALMGVVTTFGMAGEREPSYEQFSYLYSVTKSKSANHVGWVQANCLWATELGHFVIAVPTSQKSWRNRRVLLSGDGESPSGQLVCFPIPTTFQVASKLKQPIPTQSEIRQIDRVRCKVPAVERVYPQFLFTANLIEAKLVDPAEMTDERRAAEAKRMNESSNRRLMMGLQGKKAKRQAEVAPWIWRRSLRPSKVGRGRCRGSSLPLRTMTTRRSQSRLPVRRRQSSLRNSSNFIFFCRPCHYHCRACQEGLQGRQGQGSQGRQSAPSSGSPRQGHAGYRTASQSLRGQVWGNDSGSRGCAAGGKGGRGGKRSGAGGVGGIGASRGFGDSSCRSRLRDGGSALQIQKVQSRTKAQPQLHCQPTSPSGRIDQIND
ncbi:unnamed protein product [Prunus brigantina]